MHATTAPPEAATEPREGQEEHARLLTLKEAADLCGITHTAMRKRADRGGLQTVKRDGVRHVPHSELARHGLLPDAEVATLRARVTELEAEVLTHRQLAERTESSLAAERGAREFAEAAMHEHRAAAITAAAEAEERGRKLAELEERLARAGRGMFGPVRTWALAREIAELRAEAEA